MNKRNIIFICLLVVLLGCFFQFNRLDGLLKLSPVLNNDFSNDNAVTSPDTKLARDKYLIIYDKLDVASVLTRHNVTDMLQRQKKDVTIATLTENLSYDDLEKYKGIFVISGKLAELSSWEQLTAYVAAGGTVALLQHPDEGAVADDELSTIGIKSLNGIEHVFGLQINNDFILGAKDFKMNDDSNYNTEACRVELMPEAEAVAESNDGVPLIWTLTAGEGKFIVYNGMERDSKSNMGLYAAIASNMGEDSIYPVLASKVMFIDDFPAPTPEGNFSKIYDEYHLSTADFFRKIWWPYMQDNAKKYDLKYTGLIIESYGNQVSGDFTELSGRSARDNLIVYGRELLAMGGELGIHGYNHQSLVLSAQTPGVLDYVPWPSQNDMVKALTELKRYVTAVYPDYDFRVYVPPSNIMSKEGRDAVKKAFPSIKIFASLYDGQKEPFVYYQNFERCEDGTFNIPRVTAGYIPSDSMKWDAISAINDMGIMTHFVHPDELFYEESENYNWQQMADSMHNFLEFFTNRYGWLQAETASEAMEALNDYTEMDYRVARFDDRLEIYSWNYSAPLHFIIRSHKVPAKTAGCEVKVIDDNAYMVTVSEQKAVIKWEEEK